MATVPEASRADRQCAALDELQRALAPGASSLPRAVVSAVLARHDFCELKDEGDDVSLDEACVLLCQTKNSPDFAHDLRQWSVKYAIPLPNGYTGTLKSASFKPVDALMTANQDELQFLAASKNGDVDGAQSLWKLLKPFLYRPRITQLCLAAFHEMCVNGHARMARWMWHECRDAFSSLDCRSDIGACMSLFLKACRVGHVDVVDFLHSLLQAEGDPRRAYNDTVLFFRNAFQDGHVDVVKWFVRVYGSQALYRQCVRDAIHAACDVVHPRSHACLYWLILHHSGAFFDHAKLKANVESMFMSSCYFNNILLARLILSKYPVRYSMLLDCMETVAQYGHVRIVELVLQTFKKTMGEEGEKLVLQRMAERAMFGGHLPVLKLIARTHADVRVGQWSLRDALDKRRYHIAAFVIDNRLCDRNFTDKAPYFYYVTRLLHLFARYARLVALLKSTACRYRNKYWAVGGKGYMLAHASFLAHSQ